MIWLPVRIFQSQIVRSQIYIGKTSLPLTYGYTVKSPKVEVLRTRGFILNYR